MTLAGKKILVTGADGFIGSHLTEALVALGCDVRAFVFYNSFNSWGWLDESPEQVQSELDIFAGDVRDPYGVRAAMEGCEIVFHLAALISIPFSYHSPAAYIDTNVKGTLNVLQAARDLDVELVVHTSTSEVYGTAQFVPITEDHPLRGQSPYSASKIGADQLAFSFHDAFGLPVATIRPFNTYGPRQSARAVIPTIITQVLAGAARVRLGALAPTRDFNFIDDTVQAFIAMAESQGGVGDVVNIGSNYEISIGALAELIAEVMGASVEIEQEHQRLRPEASEVQRLLADNSKAREVIGWQPQYSGPDGLRRGLEKTIEWFSGAGRLSRYKAGRYNM